MEARGLVVGVDVAGMISSVNSDVRRNFRRRYSQFSAEMTDPNWGGCGESGEGGGLQCIFQTLLSDRDFSRYCLCISTLLRPFRWVSRLVSIQCLAISISRRGELFRQRGECEGGLCRVGE